MTKRSGDFPLGLEGATVLDSAEASRHELAGILAVGLRRSHSKRLNGRNATTDFDRSELEPGSSCLDVPTETVLSVQRG